MLKTKNHEPFWFGLLVLQWLQMTEMTHNNYENISLC